MRISDWSSDVCSSDLSLRRRHCMNQDLTMDVKSAVSEQEWETRIELAAAYRLMPLYGMSDLIYNHITARIPGEADRLLINPYGYLYEEITASSLNTIDVAGNVLLNPHPDYGVTPAGYVIHPAVYRTTN